MRKIIAADDVKLFEASRAFHSEALKIVQALENSFFGSYGIDLHHEREINDVVKAHMNGDRLLSLFQRADVNPNSLTEAQVTMIRALGVTASPLRLTNSLSVLLWATRNQLQNLVVCNLGCGAQFTPDEICPGGVAFDPWLSRFLVLMDLGIESIGVDYAFNGEDECFRTVRADLLKGLNPLRSLDTDSVDILFSEGLWDSPSLRMLNGFTSVRNSEERVWQSQATWMRVQNNIRSDVDRILKPNGIIIVDTPHCSFEGDVVKF